MGIFQYHKFKLFKNVLQVLKESLKTYSLYSLIIFQETIKLKQEETNLRFGTSFGLVKLLSFW